MAHTPGETAPSASPDTFSPAHRTFPSWLKKPLSFRGNYKKVSSCIAATGLHTVCIEARCPNRAECYAAGTATFLIMGNSCTRQCAFCGVHHGTPLPLDPDEPQKIADAVRSLHLRHAVITSVTRDDLPDGGAAHFAATVCRCKETVPEATIEILVPDFNGDTRALDVVLEAGPAILNHNVETVPRLYPLIRPAADFRRSLDVIAYATHKGVTAKSGIMVGLGETEAEVTALLQALRDAGCRIVTIGQYLQPSAAQVKVQEFVHPEQFSRYEQIGTSLKFDSVFAGPFVRSSYRAEEVKRRVKGEG